MGGAQDTTFLTSSEVILTLQVHKSSSPLTFSRRGSRDTVKTRSQIEPYPLSCGRERLCAVHQGTPYVKGRLVPTVGA